MVTPSTSIHYSTVSILSAQNEVLTVNYAHDAWFFNERDIMEIIAGDGNAARLVNVACATRPVKASNVETVRGQKKGYWKIGRRKVKRRKACNRNREAWSFMIFVKKKEKQGMGDGQGAKERNMKRGSVTRWRLEW